MLPCKKRRAIPVDSPEGETSPSSDAQPVKMETSSSGGIHQFQGLMQQDEEAVLSERTARLNPSADRPACSSAPTLPAPVRDLSVLEAPGGEIAKGIEAPPGHAAQKDCRESAEALLKGEKKVFCRPGSDGCQQKSEASQDPKAAPDFVVQKEQKLGHEAGGLSPKPGTECEEGDAASNAKAPKITQGSELLLEAEEEAEEMGLFIPV
ncbi:UNVERIFIED_CONTAM: hypothetical protein K2H54_017948, partial [Gekko kuhli]